MLPCEFQDLYSSNFSIIPTTQRSDYMIKSQFVDLIVPNSKTVVELNQVANMIQQTWFNKNNAPGLNITQFKVTIANVQPYTSIFNE